MCVYRSPDWYAVSVRVLISLHAAVDGRDIEAYNRSI